MKRKLTSMVFAVATLGAVAPSAHAQTYEPGEYRAKLQKWINGYRADHGLRKLRLGPRITRSARAHSTDMRHGRFFSHTSSNGRTWSSRIRYYGCRQPVIGENIAVGRLRPLDTFRAWRASPSHRALMLDPRFDWIGISMRVGRYDGVRANYVTADFSGR